MANPNKKNHLLFLSIVISVALWLIVTYAENPVISHWLYDIPVTFTGEEYLAEQGLILTNRDELDEISLRVRGTRSAVISAYDNVTAVVDLSQVASPGTKPIAITYNYPSQNISIIEKKSLALNVEIEAVNQITLPVQFKYTGDLKNKDIIVHSTLSDEEFVVRGAMSAIEQISHVLVSVDVTSLNSDSTQWYTYTLVDFAGNTVDDTDLLLDLPDSVQVMSSVYPRKTLPVNIVLPESTKADYSLDIKNISKKNIDVGILTEDTDLTQLAVPFDISQSPDGISGDMEYTLTIPAHEGIYIPEEDRKITVKATLIKKNSSSLTLEINAKNSGNRKVRVNPEKISVLVKSAGTIDQSKVTAYVDVSGLSAGSYNLPVKFDYKGDMSINYSKTVEVVIE